MKKLFFLTFICFFAFIATSTAQSTKKKRKKRKKVAKTEQVLQIPQKTPITSLWVGSWQFVEQYQGYRNGGNFQWNAIPNGSIWVLGQDSTFQEANSTCKGTYSLDSLKKQMTIRSTCNNYSVKYSLLSADSFIIDRQGREGIIRDKYKKVKQ